MAATMKNKRLHLTTCGMGGLLLSLFAATGAQAQQPLIASATALSGGSLHRAVAQLDPDPGASAPPQAGLPQIKDDLFAGTEKFAKGASSATEVNMDPDSLEMVGGSEARKAHRMVLNVVRSYSYEKPGMYNPADVDEFRKKLETGDWHCSVHTRDLKTGESTDICSRRRAPDMVENAIITAGPKELTFIHTIRKANGGESRTEFPDAGMMGMLPPQAMMAMIRPEMALIRPELNAELRAQMAILQARRGEWEPEMRDFQRRFQFDLKPNLPKDFPRLNGPEMQKHMQEMQHKMQEWQKEWQKNGPNSHEELQKPQP